MDFNPGRVASCRPGNKEPGGFSGLPRLRQPSPDGVPTEACSSRTSLAKPPSGPGFAIEHPRHFGRKRGRTALYGIISRRIPTGYLSGLSVPLDRHPSHRCRIPWSESPTTNQTLLSVPMSIIWAMFGAWGSSPVTSNSQHSLRSLLNPAHNRPALCAVHDAVISRLLVPWRAP